ncbi:MAG TPA: diacylglycerol kinase family protein [Candidatus Thermoplasmatota archaeon]|nr:diacylglycerol kinase family protein [Candidatus Thermoplasmatota archaeon]
MPPIVVLANGSAGSAAASKDQDDRVAAIRDAFQAAGVDPPVRALPGPALADAARDALAQGARVLVAAGGDGTVSTLAGVAAGTSAALAVLPMGTLNHFAKDAGLPLQLEEAARVAVEGVATPVDVAEVNGRVYVNNASVGLYAEALEERERLLEPGGSKVLAMARAAGTVLQRPPALRVRLSVDGRPRPLDTSFVVVANNAYETSLGRLGRRTTLTGRRLAVYTSRRPGRRAVLGLAARALVGRVAQAADLEAHAAHHVVLASPRGELQVGIDGELVSLRTPLRFTSRPGALLLMREA